MDAHLDDDVLLAALQLADSAFPSGAYTLSGGL
jgi:urease accessory protein UreF